MKHRSALRDDLEDNFAFGFRFFDKDIDLCVRIAAVLQKVDDRQLILLDGFFVENARSGQPAREEVVFFGVDHSEDFAALFARKPFEHDVVDSSRPSFADIDGDVYLVCLRVGNDDVLQLRLEITLFDVVFFDFVERFIERLAVEDSARLDAQLFLQRLCFHVGVARPLNRPYGRPRPHLDRDIDLAILNADARLYSVVFIG